MDGRGRAMDNIFVERLWRPVKYEEVYLKDYLGVSDTISNLGDYFAFYNGERRNRWRIRPQRQFIFRARERPVENDTADGNPQRTRIPTAVCKTLLGFAHFPQARRRRSIITTIQSRQAAAYLNEVDFLSNHWGAPQKK